MALGILLGVIAAILIAAYVTDLIRDAHAMSSETQSKLLWITWLVPVIGALYTMMVLNSDKFEEREKLKLKQKQDLSAWNLKDLHHQTEVTGGEFPDADGE